MKYYRIFFLDSNTFDIRADSALDDPDCIRFYTNGEVSAQFLKVNIAGWAEVNRK